MAVAARLAAALPLPVPRASLPSPASTSTRSASTTTTSSRCAGSCPWCCRCCSGLAALRAGAPGARGAAARAGGGGALALGLLRALPARHAAARCATATGGGSVRFVDDVARRFGPEDVVIFEQPRSIHLLSLPALGRARRERAGAGPLQPRPRAAAAPRPRLARPLPQHLLRPHLPHRPLRRVPGAGGGARRSAPSSGSAPTAASRGAASSSALRFTLSRVVPPEELQVPAAAARWTSAAPTTSRSRASTTRRAAASTPTAGRVAARRVYLPGRARGSAVVITASAGRRPARDAGGGARVASPACASGAFTAGPEWAEHALALPPAPPAGPPRAAPRRARAGGPTNAEPGCRATRATSGVMVDRVRVLPAGRSRFR